MSAFDAWRNWAGTLGEADLACAWAALGIAAAAPVESAALAAGGGLRRIDLARARAADYDAIARAAVLHACSDKQGRFATADWLFPHAEAFVDRERTVRLDAIAPASWAAAWRDVRSNVGGPGRLRVAQYPQDQPAWPWFGPLTGAPWIEAVRMRPVRESRVALDWPLRLGCLPSAPAQAILEQVRRNWPSDRLSRLVMLDRQWQRCDVLLHVGSTEALSAALADHPAQCKATLVVLCGVDFDAGDALAAVTSIQALCDANGVVGLRSSTSTDALVRTLNRLVENVSHNEWLDMAVTHTFARDARQDALVWVSDALAAMRLDVVIERIKARILAVPPGTRFTVPGGSGQIETRTRRGPVLPGAPAAPVDEAQALASGLEGLSFDHESDGASRAASVAEVLERAVAPEAAQRARADRFLQQQSFVGEIGHEQPAANGFVAGQPAHVCMRIGPSEGQWQGLRQAIAVETLPQDVDTWTLTIALTEPTYLPRGLTATVELPRDGASNAADFRFTPPAEGRFDAVVTVQHRGRVLQTAGLTARVLAPGAALAADAAPALSDVLPVRQAMHDLDGRQQFDRAVVFDSASDGKPRGVALADDRAWIVDVEKSVQVANAINAALSDVAQSVADYADGLAGEAGCALLVELAAQGSVLHDQLVKEQLEATGNRARIARCEYIQVVSTRSDAIVPFEFIYDYASPNQDAKVCPHWREGVQAGACPSSCHTDDPAVVCPVGFWGLQKVIERHQIRRDLAAEGKPLFLVSDPDRRTSELRLAGASLVASSRRVKAQDLVPVQTSLARQTGIVAATASTWQEWVAIVAASKPAMIIALPHADGTGAHVSLEIGGDTLETRQLSERHVRPQADSPPPLVALLGCDIAGTGGDYGDYVGKFRTRGAAVVIATIATVVGEHAARTAVLLADALVPQAGATPQRLGEAMRAVKRRALLEGLLMPMCLVAYGDADWSLTR
jgi:hypothetical protein